MSTNGYSPEELDFLEILKNVECMSVSSAFAILTRYMHMSEGQIHKVLNHLYNKYRIDYIGEQKYIVCGNRNLGGTNTDLQPDVVAAISYALQKFYEDNESLDTVLNMLKVRKPATLKFVSGGCIYTTYCLTYDGINSKLELIETKELEKIRQFMDDKYINSDLKNNRKSKAVFIFSESSKTERILEKMTNMHIEIPHEIVIVKKDKKSDDLLLDIYG